MVMHGMYNVLYLSSLYPQTCNVQELPMQFNSAHVLDNLSKPMHGRHELTGCIECLWSLLQSADASHTQVHISNS